MWGGEREGERFEMASPVRALLATRDLRDVRYPYAVPGAVSILLLDVGGWQCLRADATGRI